MRAMYCASPLFFVLSITSVVTIVESDTTDWNYHLWLAPEYSLKWNVDTNEQSITFLCEVATTGWIGFGLSPNGGMKGSDVVIGWVDDSTGASHFSDMFATDESLPQIDESQDWDLLSADQNGTHTIISFRRQLISCDKIYDRDITRDTIRLIFAFGTSDPKSETDIRIHGRHQRGARSVLLLSHPESQQNEPTEPDLQSLVINVQNVKIPKRETTYWCKIVKMKPDKVHVVKFKPYITAGNEPFVHHITVSACFHPNSGQMDKYLSGEGSDCTDSANMPKDFLHCFNPYFMWAVGGGPFLLPKDVGFPIGDNTSDTYLLINMHYDNPELVEDVIDSSGLQLYYTRTMRKYEAFTTGVGSAMDNRLFVPPRQQHFHISGHCNTKCFDNVMDPNGLNVFAVWPHAHLLATKIKTRHFRGNQELPWIEFDDNYDFNLQSFRTLDPMVKIKSGDQITVECEYDSSHKNSTVMGGFGTRDEMCLSFLLYYPKMIPSKLCVSGLTPETIKTLANIGSEVDINSELTEYLSSKQDWNQTTLNRSHEIMLSDRQTLQCYWLKTDNDRDIEEGVGYPELTRLYSPPELKCWAKDEVSNHTTNVIVILLTAIVLVILIAVALVCIQKRNPKYVNRLV